MLVQVAVGTGLRWSELTALQVRDLDLTGPVPSLAVRRAWKRNPKGEFAVAGAGGFYLGVPGTLRVFGHQMREATMTATSWRPRLLPGE